MEQRPFDGVVMRLNAGKTIFNKTAYPESAFAADRADLGATKFSKLNQIFISLCAPREANWSWFDDADWATTMTNATNVAKTAKAGGVKGFFFDPEQYDTKPWSLLPKPEFRGRASQNAPAWRRVSERDSTRDPRRENLNAIGDVVHQKAGLLRQNPRVSQMGTARRVH